MELMDKLTILGDAAKYDASCASSGGGRKAQKGGLGNAHFGGICHTWAADGRCISLLKVLMSNQCRYDCAYCLNRCSSNVSRAEFEPEELARLTIEFYRRNYIEGLFLSSGVTVNPNETMERMIKVLQTLREKHQFFGYIHVKVIPGSDPIAIQRLGLLADRLSVNIELPSAKSLQTLAPQKTAETVLAPMNTIHRTRKMSIEDRRKFKNAPVFSPAGQATQMIVGATPDTDLSILRLSKGLYKRYELKRVYFSAYIPVGKSPLLPGPDAKVPLLREHRLYQADWLMRFYQFDAEEILEENAPLLDTELDPKAAWALRHRDLYPVEVNTADYEMLLRIPGVGVQSAQRIVQARRHHSLSLEDLRKIGTVMKRARYFLTANGHFGGAVGPDSPLLRDHLAERRNGGQLSLFEPEVNVSRLTLTDASKDWIEKQAVRQLGDGKEFMDIV